MLSSIESAIEDIKQGKLVIVVDDEDRENEGDFITAARKVTPETINFMSKYGRGLICAPLVEERCSTTPRCGCAPPWLKCQWQRNSIVMGGALPPPESENRGSPWSFIWGRSPSGRYGTRNDRTLGEETTE